MNNPTKRYAPAPPAYPDRTYTRKQWKELDTQHRLRCIPRYLRPRFAAVPSATVIWGRVVFGPAAPLP